VMGHRTPRVILRWWLREPDVACIAGKLPAFKCTPGLKSMCFGVGAN
jgi:hypothetical protein